MNRLERFIQIYHEWSLRRMARRVVARLKRSVKRRMKGESHRQWFERNLHDSEAGIMLDIVQSLISVTMVCSIIDQNWTKSDSEHKSWYQLFDVSNLLSISVNFSLRLYAASNRKGFFYNWLSLIDMATAIPLLLQTVHVTMDTARNKYLYRFLLMVRTIRILQLYRLLRLAKSAKTRQGLLIALTVICIIICGAITFQTIEYCDPAFEGEVVPGVTCQNLSFLDSIYFVCITIGTVGYGDIAPKTRVGKLTDVLMIIIAGTAISTLLGGYTDILSRETAFDKKYEPDKSIQHILLCGEVDHGALRFFLDTWLRTEGERENHKKVIILAPALPSNSLRRILIEREFEQRVVYLQGSAMVTADLQRAAAPSAAYCFVLTKKHSEAHDQNDTATNLLTCSVRKNNRHAPLYVQVSKHDNARHVNISGASAVVCLEQLRLAIVGKSMWMKGLNAFLGNLVQRFVLGEESKGSWLSDYLSGCSHRIYEVTLPPCLRVLPTFKALAMLLYREFSAPSIGLRTIEDTAVVFPVDKALRDVDFLSVFVIAKSKDIALMIEKLTVSVLSRHADLMPHSDGTSSTATSRSATGAMASFFTVMESKLPFRGMSATLSDDSRSVRSARSVAAQQASRRSLASIGRQGSRSGGGDKITPVLVADECGDGPTALRERSNVYDSLKPPKHQNLTNLTPKERCDSVADDEDASANSVDEDEDEDEDDGNRDSTSNLFANKSTPPVIAMSPAELLKKASGAYAPAATKPPDSMRPPASKHSNRTPRSDYDNHPPHNRSAEQNVRNLMTLTPRSAREASFSKRSTVFPDAVATDSLSNRNTSALSAHAYHVSTSSSGVALDAADTCELSSKQLDERESSGNTHDADDYPVEVPVIPRRRSSEAKDPRLRRISMLRSFRRAPPPPTLSGHYVVCGTPSNYSDFLLSLCDLDEPLAAVVFVTPRDLNEKDFEAHKLHRELYFVRGSPVSAQVLHTARMLFARSILILAYCATECGVDSDSESEAEQMDENMADVDAITAHRFISEAFQNSSVVGASAKRTRISVLPTRGSTPFIVAEMIRPSNTKFLIDCSSSLYDESAGDNELRKREALRDAKCIDDSFFSALYASGHIHFTNVMDALLGSCSQHTLLIEMVTQLVTSGNLSKHRSDNKTRGNHRLTQLPAPARFHYRPYAVMVESLLREENLMALGMYRGVSTHLSPAYVFTNPSTDELVTPHDLVFVIT